jgi:Carboxypeptidase regulatory-like domain/TonB dependent receptor-like, beta-barrel
MKGTASKASVVIGATLVTLFMLCTHEAQAQYTTGSIGGTVVDSSGAVIPQTKVTVRNTATGVAQSQTSGTDGAFAFPTLKVGIYDLTVEKEGFIKYVHSGLTVTVNQPTSLSITLQVGSFTQNVTVTGRTPLVNASTSTVSQLVDQRQIIELPLNGRTPQSLVFLSAGTVDSTAHIGTGAGGVYPGEQQATIHGGTSDETNYQLDGGSYNDTYLNSNLPFPNPDAVQEFSLQSANYSAEFGNAASGIVNIVTKSGTNEIHGDGFEFVRNGALNARNFFAASQDTLKRNQFGGTIGGPIKKDKLFFFGSYQGTRQTSAAGGKVAFVPTADERAGDFSAISSKLKDPVTGVAFTNNQIQGSLSSVALNLLKSIPLPNGPNGQLTFSLPASVQNENQFLAKVDYYRGKNQISGHYYNTNFDRPPVTDKNNLLADSSQGDKVRVQSIAVNHSYTASPTMLFNTWFGWEQQTGGSQSSAPFGFPDVGVKIAAPPTPELPISVGGFFTVNTNHLGNFNRGDWTVREEVTLSRGRHDIRFGGEAVRLNNHLVNTFSMSGSFTFGGKLSGNNLADFMLGRASAFRQGAGEYKLLAGTRLGLFVQDNYRATNRLTLNLGLRWDPYLPYLEQQGRVVCFRPGAQSQRFPNAPVGILFGGKNHDPGCPEAGVQDNLGNFAPRVGFAYRLTSDGKTSLRGGGGFFYSPPSTTMFNNNADTAPFGPQFNLTDVDFTDPFGSQGIPNPFPAQYGPTVPGPNATFTPPISIGGTFPKDWHMPVDYQWNLTLERSFANSWHASASYVGNKGAFLTSWIKNTQPLNPAIYIPGLSTEANTQSRRIYPTFGPVGLRCGCDNSNFNALELNLEKRFGQGLSIATNYTWAKARDDFGTYDPFKRIYGLSAEDVKGRFNLSAVWQIPQVKGSGAWEVLKGWELAPIISWQGGFPFSIASGVDNSFTGQGSDHADFIGTNLSQAILNPDRPHGQLIQEYFDTSLWTVNAIGTFGNAGKNILRNPGMFDTDLGISKKTRITERVSAQFRAEFFNFFNNVNFNDLPRAQTVGDPDFGHITSAKDPRIIQFGFKVMF